VISSRILAILTLTVFALVIDKEAHSITWCHDFVYYEVSGKDRDRLTVRELTNLLKKNHAYTMLKWEPKLRLEPSDVVVAGSAHSGIVNASGEIEHYFAQPDPSAHISSTSSFLTIKPANIRRQDTHNYSPSVDEFLRSRLERSGKRKSHKLPVMIYRKVATAKAGMDKTLEELENEVRLMRQRADKDDAILVRANQLFPRVNGTLDQLISALMALAPNEYTRTNVEEKYVEQMEEIARFCQAQPFHVEKPAFSTPRRKSGRSSCL